MLTLIDATTTKCPTVLFFFNFGTQWQTAAAVFHRRFIQTGLPFSIPTRGSQGGDSTEGAVGFLPSLETNGQNSSPVWFLESCKTKTQSIDGRCLFCCVRIWIFNHIQCNYIQIYRYTYMMCCKALSFFYDALGLLRRNWKTRRATRKHTA